LSGKITKTKLSLLSPGRKLIVNLIRASDAVSHRFDAFLKEYGLTGTQYETLLILRGAGNKGATRSGIAARLIKAEPDVTRLLDRLERHAWVRRERDPADRRAVNTWITIEGIKLLATLDRPVRDLQSRTFARMTLKEIEQLTAGLEKIQAALSS
jgi:DNA-binding MarR family transcriptional regulator